MLYFENIDIIIDMYNKEFKLIKSHQLNTYSESTNKSEAQVFECIETEQDTCY